MNSVIQRLIHAVFGLALTAMSLLLVTMTGGATLAALLDPRDRSVAIWAAPGLLISCYCLAWSVRLMIGRRRADGGLLSPGWLIVSGLFLTGLPPVLLLTGMYEQTGLPRWFMILLSLACAVSALGYSVMVADRRYGSWEGIAGRIDRYVSEAGLTNAAVAEALQVEPDLAEALREEDEAAAVYLSLAQVIDLAHLLKTSPRQLAYGVGAGADDETISAETLVDSIGRSKAAAKHRWDMSVLLEDPQRIWVEWSLSSLRQVCEAAKLNGRPLLPAGLQETRRRRLH